MLTVTCPPGEAEGIAYTLDGSDPRTSTTKVVAPLPLRLPIDPASTTGRKPAPAVTLRVHVRRTGGQAAPVHTHTFVFPASVAGQPNFAPAGTDVFWNTVIDPRVTQDPRYRDKLVPSLRSIPTVSVVMDDAHLFGPMGIHRGNNLMNRDLERPASLELLYPDGPKFAGKPGFQIDAGAKIQGGATRWNKGTTGRKQSFGIKFSELYGPSRLRYPAMESSPLPEVTAGAKAELNRLILRASFNESLGTVFYPRSQRENVVLARDEWGRASQIAMSGVGSHGTFVHLYLNGIYWGLYSLVERPDHHFSSIYFGGKDEQWFSWKNKRGTLNGSDARFRELRGPVVASGDIARIRGYLDTASYADWVLLTWYIGTADLQWYVGQRMEPAGPLRYYAWDLEDSWGLGPRAGLGARIGGAPDSQQAIFHGYDNVAAEEQFFQKMAASAEFRVELADRAWQHLARDGVLTEANARRRWSLLTAFIEEAVIAEYARWGDEGEPGRPINRDDHWYKARDRVAEMMLGNPKRLIDAMRARGYYPPLDPPRVLDGAGRPVETRRLAASAAVTLDLVESPGAVPAQIAYTLDGTDPRLPGGGLAPGAREAAGRARITAAPGTRVKARQRAGDAWSALNVLEVGTAAGAAPAP
jgi:hypothetical protein